VLFPKRPSPFVVFQYDAALEAPPYVVVRFSVSICDDVWMVAGPVAAFLLGLLGFVAVHSYQSLGALIGSSYIASYVVVGTVAYLAN
jgi:hypothetical protein